MVIDGFSLKIKFDACYSIQTDGFRQEVDSCARSIRNDNSICSGKSQIHRNESPRSSYTVMSGAHAAINSLTGPKEHEIVHDSSECVKTVNFN